MAGKSHSKRKKARVGISVIITCDSSITAGKKRKNKVENNGSFENLFDTKSAEKPVIIKVIIDIE